ncbi:FISUMP domain-containing protein [Duncaniella freteri]|uniref:FISUMP domain-containing protein n=1 Tax=Duncaniella freteri TaxID=2530391 RepID=UPI0025523687|nr:FISUMP domain-containing protein [Duncaniella freteri]
MRKLLYMVLAVIPCVFASCSDDDDVVVSPSASGTMTDDLGNEYGWVRIGNLEWTTSNARNGASMLEYEFDNEQGWGNALAFGGQLEYAETEYMPRYGNLLTYDDALASVPEGWRLPTDEDWKNLERTLGSADVDSFGMRGSAGQALMTEGSGPQIGLLLGGAMIGVRNNGWIDKNISHEKEYGYYWTSTTAPDAGLKKTAYFRKVVFGNERVGRDATDRTNLLSVRWCRDAQR